MSTEPAAVIAEVDPVAYRFANILSALLIRPLSVDLQQEYSSGLIQTTIKCLKTFYSHA